MSAPTKKAEAVAGGWRPIGTAPKDWTPETDGTWFVARQNGKTFPCSWMVVDDGEMSCREGWWDYFNRSFEEPTEWFPAGPTLASLALQHQADDVAIKAVRFALSAAEERARLFRANRQWTSLEVTREQIAGLAEALRKLRVAV